MALPTASIGSLDDLLAIKDQLTGGQVSDIKQHLLNKKTLPSTFFSDIASLRNQRAHDLLSETEHSTLLNDHINAHVKKTQMAAPAGSTGGSSSELTGVKRKAASSGPKRKGRARAAAGIAGTPNIVNAFVRATGEPVSRLSSLTKDVCLSLLSLIHCANEILSWRVEILQRERQRVAVLLTE